MIKQISFVNKKSDIWALGCIVYELITATRAFKSDYSIYEYVHYKEMPEFPELAIDERLKACLRLFLSAAFTIDWWERPSTEDILTLFSCLSQRRCDVFVLDCPEIRGSSGPSPAYLRTMRSSDKEKEEGIQIIMRFRNNSQLWERVSWDMFWYSFFLRDFG